MTAFFTGKDPGADVGGIAGMLGVKKEKIYLPVQKHTDKIILLESSRETKVADAVVTKEAGVLLGIQVADCVPVLIYDAEKGVIGAVHAGWRGTAAGILKKTLILIMERYVCGTEGLLVAIGPSIKGCSYLVDHEVNDAVKKATGEGDYYVKKGDKYGK